MNTKDNHQDPKPLVEGSDASSELKAQSESRRRLLKKAGLVAVPVVTTLASRPVLAWHCRTPSMWGSMAMNPATSLMKHTDHLMGVVDESWYIYNWRDNSSRSYGETRKPWNVLFKSIAWPNRPTVFFTSSGTGRIEVRKSSTNKRYVDLNSYNVADFCSDTGISCGTLSGTLGTIFSNLNSFSAHLLVAQLNEKLLSGVQQCIGAQLDLADVAKNGGNVVLNGVQWTPERFIDYFEANWIAVADSTSQSLWSGGTLSDNPGDLTQIIRQKIYESPTAQDRHYFTTK